MQATNLHSKYMRFSFVIQTEISSAIECVTFCYVNISCVVLKYVLTLKIQIHLAHLSYLPQFLKRCIPIESGDTHAWVK